MHAAAVKRCLSILVPQSTQYTAPVQSGTVQDDKGGDMSKMSSTARSGRVLNLKMTAALTVQSLDTHRPTVRIWLVAACREERDV